MPRVPTTLAVGVVAVLMATGGGLRAQTGMATAEEDNFFGKHAMVEPEAPRWKHSVIDYPPNTIDAWEMVGSGLAAVWATENTREAIWDAFARKEVYATTSPA